MSSLRGALAYPVFLVILSFGVIIFILTFVFPKFGSLFEEIRDQLPFTTLFLLFASDILRNYWIGILGGMGAGFWMALKWVKIPKVKEVLDRLYFSIPGIKDFLLKFYISRLMHTLGALLGGGVLLVEALQICRGVGSSSRFSRFLDAIVKSVEEGKGLAHPIGQADFIPDLVKQMVRTGEETGNLPLVMSRIGDYYDEELDRRLKTFSTLLEPTLLLMMGAVVGLVVISLILPIFKLTRAIH
jgi:type II secretory pathway component PulF